MQFSLRLFGALLLVSACGDSSSDSAPDASTTDAGGPITLSLELDNASPEPGQSIEARLSGHPDGANLRWSLSSRSATSVNCNEEYQLSEEGDTLAITVPLAHTDVRCADEIEVSVSVGDARATANFAISAPTGLGENWTAAPNNPIVPLSTCPEWDCLNHSDPTIARNTDGKLVMWFAAGGDEGGPVVGRAVQNGQGAFTPTPNAPVMAPDTGGVPEPLPWDYKRETPSVQWDEASNRWHMAYLGYSVSFFDDPALGYVRSLDADGTEWERAAAPVYTPSKGNWDASFLTAPTVMQGSDGVWRMYYVGASFAENDATMKVGVLESTDRETWTPRDGNPILEGVPGEWDESILDCHVAFVGGQYMMWYTGFSGEFVTSGPAKSLTRFYIGLATSEDGYNWTRHGQNPVIEPGAPGSWNSLKTLDGEVFLEEDGSLVMGAYGGSEVAPNPKFPEFRPDRLGLWRSTKE